MKAFLDKWNLPEAMYQYSEEQQEMIRNENPGNAEFTPLLFLNGNNYSGNIAMGILGFQKVAWRKKVIEVQERKRR